MSDIVISVENLSKAYHLGQIGTGTLANDLKVWWAKKRGLPNPLLKIGENDHDDRDGEIVWALRDVSFSVGQGELLGIIGHNGAGKSTVLKILSQVTAPTKGLVKVKGNISSLLEIGTGFHPDLTGRENIYLNGSILGMAKPEISGKFDEIVSFSEIGKYIDTPVKRYSSGMYVRLAFSVSAFLESKIMIVDEVLAVGDASFQKKCIGVLEERRKNGQTILFVSHNLEIINRICTRVLVIDHGKIIDNGLPWETTSNYRKASGSMKSFEENANRKRSGTGEIRITEILLLDQLDNLITQIESGKKIIIRIKFRSQHQIESPVFSISSINSINSTMYFENATIFDKFEIGTILGEGHLDFVIESLTLVAGIYSLSFAIADQKGLIQYDFLSNWINLEISGNNFGRGMVNFNHHWKLTLKV